MAGELLDGLARALAEPMPRRRAVRTVVASLAALAVPGLSPTLPSAAAAPTRRGGSAVAKCPDGSECRNEGEVCCPMPSPLSGQFNCCKTTNHCCCGNACCDPEKQVCACPGRPGVGGRCIDKVCGPNLSEPVAQSVAWMRMEFARWSSLERSLLCGHLYSLGPIAWDIAELDPPNRQRFIRRHAPLECRTCGDPEVIQIGNECHHAGSVNYVVFGAMMRLCRDHLKGTSFARWFGVAAMDTLIVLHKTDLETGVPAGNLEGSLRWANAGFGGWPRRDGDYPQGDRPNCRGSCGSTYKGPPLTVRWSYKRIKLP